MIFFHCIVPAVWVFLDLSPRLLAVVNPVKLICNIYIDTIYQGIPLINYVLWKEKYLLL